MALFGFGKKKRRSTKKKPSSHKKRKTHRDPIAAAHAAGYRDALRDMAASDPGKRKSVHVHEYRRSRPKKAKKAKKSSARRRRG